MRCRPLLFLSLSLALFLCLFVLAHSAEASTLNFAAPVPYAPGGNGPNAVVVADLNGDGKPDIVTANWCMNNTSPCPQSSVGVLLNNGDGTFGTTRSYDSGGIYADGVAVGDLNGDGIPDIVVVNCGNALSNHCIGAGGNAGVLFGNGDGTFQPVVSLTLGGGGYGAIDVAIADVNLDGKNDIVVAGDCASGGCGGVLLGNGDGTFQPEISFGSGGLIAFSLAIGDVNGDGKPDAVVGNQCSVQACKSSTVGVALGNGNGTFQPAVAYNSGGLYADGVEIADLRGDGNADIVIANSSTSVTVNQGDVGVLLGNGDGTFQPVVAYAASEFGAADIKVADVNGDGKPDVIVVNCSATSGNCTGGGGDVGVLLGNGDGTLQPVVTFSPGEPSPFGVAVADLNGDSKPDIIVASCAANTCGNSPGGVSLLLNTSLGVSATQLASSPNPSNFGQNVTFTATVVPQGFKVTPTGSVTFFDGTTSIGFSNLNANAVATLTTSTLSVGTHNITATYNGDSNYAASTSGAVSQLVQGAIAQVSPSSLNFGNQTVGILSAPQGVSLTNTGNVALTVSIGIAGTNKTDFHQTNTCGTSVAPGSHCSISVSFDPAATGTRTAMVSITDNAPNSPQEVSLTGSGVLPAVTLSPNSLTFPDQIVGTTSAGQTVTLTNTGLGVLRISKGSISGPFLISSNTCTSIVNPGASCMVTVKFRPKVKGNANGSITVTDNAPSSPQTVMLTGTGT